ncbi:hypothetical protein Trco_005387 [Trichoderma cornu-damae]|uniref:Cytochrome P450 n=1 Tax=Trichoderma cornu-damae TaxID=654480 RepID=A0A9P8TWF3_9HYPO|nr:hypothetical protein Trco_005387 [Trichoderma cornu-damae]
MSSLAVAPGILFLIGILLYHLFFREKPGIRLPLPPGPDPLPILGNIRDGPPPGVPDYQHWLSFKDKYGPISSMTVLGQTAIIIHDKEAITELLEKTSLRTSARPKFKFSTMCGFGQYVTLLQYNDQYRLYRKLIHQQIGTKSLASQYADIQDVESKREAAAMILKLTYGYTIELHQPDPLVKLIEQVMAYFSEATIPLSWLVDLFPALEHLPDWCPGTGFKRFARECKTIVDASADIPFNFVEKQMEKSTYQPSYTSKLIQVFKNDGKMAKEETAQAIKWTAAVLFAGGSDTTVSTLMAFVLAMVLNPDVQRKAQEEIDRVIGSHRLPAAGDQDKLPYINGIVKESLRYFPITPMGVAHETDEEITFRGYRIPKGSYILPCVWWYLNDPKTYPEPSRFVPERFLAPRNEPDPEDAFGYGRRVCLGRYIAQETLFLTISRTLAAFTIGKAMQGGKPVDVECKHSTGLLDHPVEFPYSIVPRNEEYAEMIRRVELDHPWEGSSVEALEGSDILQRFKEDLQHEAQ